MIKNSKRMLVRIVREIAQECEIEYKTFSYDWIIRLTKSGESRVIVGYDFPLNSSTSATVCTDKSAASAFMEECGVPCVHHHFFMRPSVSTYIGKHGNWCELIDMLSNEKELVCKPNEGTCGNQIFRVNDLPSLENAVEKIFASHRSMAVCRYHDIQSEHRVMLLDGQAQVIFKKCLPYVVGDGQSTIAMLTTQKYPALVDELSATGHVPAHGDKVNVGWRHNLDKGSSPENMDLSDPLAQKLAKLAVDAAAACGVRFASVDIIIADNQPEPLVIEINSGVMMEKFASYSNQNYDIAKSAYRRAIEAMW